MHATGIRRTPSGLLRPMRSIAILALAAPLAARATDRIWTGAADIAYTNGANWAGGVAPLNTDYQDRAVFRENSPSNRTPTLYANRVVNALRFEDSTGWSFDGSGRTIVLKVLYSSGSGTNTVVPQLKNAAAGPWTIGPGNTVASAQLYIDNSDLTVTGGGTLAVSSAIQGWRSNRILSIANATVRVAASSPTGTTGSVRLTTKASRLQILNTVAGAKALIGSRIVDGLGQGLWVRDIGGGYAEVFPKETTTVLVLR